MLISNLFTFLSIESIGDNLVASVQINGENKLFEGHFPNQPITPGVLQVQLVKEIITEHFGKTVELISLDRCKFLSIWNPNEEPVINVKLTLEVVEGVVKVKVVGSGENNTYFKFSAKYQ